MQTFFRTEDLKPGLRLLTNQFVGIYEIDIVVDPGIAVEANGIYHYAIVY